jgi:hypothetical protein
MALPRRCRCRSHFEIPLRPRSCHVPATKNRRRKFLLLAASLLAISGAALLWQKLAEPSYQGKSLSHWLGRMPRSGEVPPEVREAIRQIGPQAVPWLVTWLAYETPPWRKRLNDLCKQHQSLKCLETDESQRYRRGLGAMDAFEILGPEARKAKQELLRLFKGADPTNHYGGTTYVTYRAAIALGAVAPEAFPLLLGGLSSGNGDREASCAFGLKNAGTNAVSGLPEVLEHLVKSERGMKDLLQEAAEEMVKGGQPAVPYLQKVLQSGSFGAREWATNALLNIAPETLTNAPPR